MKTTVASIMQTAAAIKERAKREQEERLLRIPPILDAVLAKHAAILARGSPLIIHLSFDECHGEDLSAVGKLLNDAGFQTKNCTGYDDDNYSIEVKINPL